MIQAAFVFAFLFPLAFGLALVLISHTVGAVGNRGNAGLGLMCPRDCTYGFDLLRNKLSRGRKKTAAARIKILRGNANQ